MSTQLVKQFWKKVESDEALQQRIEGLFQQVDDQPVASAQEVVRLAKQSGFEFTTDDLKEYLVTSGRDAQLSESELADVSGGALNAYAKESSLSFLAVKMGQGTILF